MPIPGQPSRRQVQRPTCALIPLPQRATPACKSVRCGVSDGRSFPRLCAPRIKASGPRLHAPRRGCWGTENTQTKTAGKQEGRPEDPPHHSKNYSKGLQHETRRSTNHMERPYQRPASDITRCVRKKAGRGGGGASTAGARAKNQLTDTRRAPKQQTDRGGGTQRPHGMAYQQARTRNTKTRQPATRTARHARGGKQGGEGR